MPQRMPFWLYDSSSICYRSGKDTWRIRWLSRTLWQEKMSPRINPVSDVVQRTWDGPRYHASAHSDFGNVTRPLLILIHVTVARAALKRKKVHEKNLEQTTAQIAQIEQQIYSIEAANINQETLNAMKNAGQAMKQIHGGLTIDKVDQTMYLALQPILGSFADRLLLIGTSCVNSMPSAKRSRMRLRTRLWVSLSTRTSSKMSSKA